MTPENVYDWRFMGDLVNPAESLDGVRRDRTSHRETATIALVNGETVFSWGIHRNWWPAGECDEYDRGHDALDAAIKMVEAENPQQSAEEHDCKKVTRELDHVGEALEVVRHREDGIADKLRQDTARAITGFLLRYPDMCAMVRSATRDRDGGPMSQEQWGDDV